MANRKIVAGMLALALMFGIAAAVSAVEPAPPALSPKLLELLGRYAGAEQQTWGKDAVSVYYVDPLRFEEFKAELDALGKYQAGSWNEVRDWDKGLTFARWVARANGSFELSLCKADNSVSGYRYKKFPKAQKLKADELLQKYAGARPRIWPDEGNILVHVYYLDPPRFEAFKKEFDALGEYSQSDWWKDENRGWEQGKTFATLGVRPDGSCQLQLDTKDNDEYTYQYKKAGKPKR